VGWRWLVVAVDASRVVDPGWRRLGERIGVERGRRWKSRAAFARAAGLSSRLIDDIELGRRDNYSEGTLGALEAALGWAPGTCLRVVQGGKVRRDIDPDLVRLLDVWRRLSPDARAMLVEVAERSAERRH
jgi:transcriptional regulator with XRE-family HTH domain